MSRLLIVSRIIPGAEGRVAQIFAESDATELPGLTGVTHRSLYCLHDLCVHLLETSDVDPDALAAARNHPLFRQVNERLSAHTSPYLPTWRSPRTPSPAASTVGRGRPRAQPVRRAHAAGRHRDARRARPSRGPGRTDRTCPPRHPTS